MAKPRAILNRAKSIKSIAKITDTMYKIAAAKFKRAFDRAVAATAEERARVLAAEAPAVRAEVERLLAIDDRVAEIIAALKDRGFDSPYLRNFVVARIRPFRPRGKPAPDADALLDHMERAAEKFDAGKVRSEQVAKTAGGGE